VILADTSVWLRALYNREPYRGVMDQLLQKAEIVGHEFIYGELLIGDSGGRTKILATYAMFPYAAIPPHDEIVAFARTRRLHGRGIGWIDVHILASALAGRHQLWTADGSLAAVARELGVAWNNPALLVQ
jgi:predicted nucleic acid-binding protein